LGIINFGTSEYFIKKSIEKYRYEFYKKMDGLDETIIWSGIIIGSVTLTYSVAGLLVTGKEFAKGKLSISR
jgi:hypothetical protein